MNEEEEAIDEAIEYRKMTEKNSIEKREFASLIFLEENLLDSKEEGVSLRVGWNERRDPFDFNPTRIILGISRKEKKKKRKKKKERVMDRN